MADTGLHVQKQSSLDSVFTSDAVVVGMSVLELVNWVTVSNNVINQRADNGNRPIIAMPPIQRTSVWGAKQVVDLWDSLMRGLPIGTFYLVEQPGAARELVLVGGDPINNSHQETQQSERAGFDLLDGQQRVRALLAGVYGPKAGKFCIWVDLGAESADQKPCLRVTSKAQPFGYDGNSGKKLSVPQRKAARKAIEPDPEKHPLKPASGENRPAYNLELFDVEVIQDGQLIDQPPQPFDATRYTFKLHELLGGWRKHAVCGTGDRVAALLELLPVPLREHDGIDSALRVLDKAFLRVEAAQVALLRIKPDEFADTKQTLLTLFERIGAGGTPLSSEERLFSIYKHYVPQVRDAVEVIYARDGRLLPQTKIVATALRIANATLAQPGYTVPDVGTFAKQMAAQPSSELRERLGCLIPLVSGTIAQSEGLISRSFKATKSLLSYTGKDDAFWMPDVVLARLPAELWQALVFWTTQKLQINNQAVDFETSREEIVRFALFWYIFVSDNEKALQRTFSIIKTEAARSDLFPGSLLYQRLVETVPNQRCAITLIKPESFSGLLCKEPNHSWLTDKQRFGEGSNRNEIGARWWWSGEKILPWLQRNYVREKFPEYVPLSDHEDDLPYEIDHVIPKADWNDWVSVKRRIPDLDRDWDTDTKQRMQWYRSEIGDSIGNKRVVDAGINVSDSDDDISEKMPFLVKDCLNSEASQQFAEMAFAPSQWYLWKKVSFAGDVISRIWSYHRIAAFQQAVEHRAAWLYGRFYGDLNFEPWIIAQIAASVVIDGWSKETREKTRDAMTGLEPIIVRDGQIYLKHFTSGFATMTEANHFEGVLKITNKQTNEQTTFPTIDALIDAGWAID